MAYKPSLRRKSAELDMDLDIKPVMNLMVVLIPLLLAGTEFVKLSIIEINLPPQSQGSGEDEQNPDREIEKQLNLSIVITKSGFTITSPSAVLPGESDEGPTVAINDDNSFNFEALKEKLVEVKKMIAEKSYKDKDSVIITASADIEYQVIIDVIDSIQLYEDDEGNLQPLFPQVNFGKVL
ncbi:MAG: biopolymer transporter ExbD [Calditrichia bacterium]|nr:biopolymer transporter ExbD [Calditrichia bacterium]